MISVAMSAEASAAAASAVTVTLSSRPSHRAAENHRRRARQMPRQQRERLAELPGPRARDRVIEGDDEARRGRRVEAPLDQLPRLEIVGQRQRAEIVAERRAGAGRDREHGGDARHDGDVERAPGMRPALHRLQHRGGHGEHAGVAARDDGDVGALGGMAQRGLSARAFLAIVGRMPRLVRPHRHAIEIRRIAVKRVGGRQARRAPPA